MKTLTFEEVQGQVVAFMLPEYGDKRHATMDEVINMMKTKVSTEPKQFDNKLFNRRANTLTELHENLTNIEIISIQTIYDKNNLKCFSHYEMFYKETK